MHAVEKLLLCSINTNKVQLLRYASQKLKGPLEFFNTRMINKIGKDIFFVLVVDLLS